MTVPVEALSMLWALNTNATFIIRSNGATHKPRSYMRFSHRDNVDSPSGRGLGDHGDVAMGSSNGFENAEVARGGNSVEQILTALCLSIV